MEFFLDTDPRGHEVVHERDVRRLLLLDRYTTVVDLTSGYRLGPVEQIPLGESRACAIDGKQVAVFRTRNRELRAIEAVCPHAGGPLADEQIDRQRVLCPLHSHIFTWPDESCTTGDYAVRTYTVGKKTRSCSSWVNHV